MTQGQLYKKRKKAIDLYWGQEIPDSVTGYFEVDGEGRWVPVTVLDEAKKDFPTVKIVYLKPQSITPINDKKAVAAFEGSDTPKQGYEKVVWIDGMKVLYWFEKWFGSEDK